jgi:hypothetical protein
MTNRNENSSKPLKPIEPVERCANCGEIGSVMETEITGIPFGCQACGYWGHTATTTDNPPPDDDWNPTGQVPRRPTE